MAELLLFGALAFVVGLAIWVRLAGTRPQDAADEPPTLDTRGPDDRPGAH